MANTQQAAEVCDNCGRSIGRLETPYAHGQHVVCGECYARLIPPAQPVAYASPPQYLPPVLAGSPPRVQTVEATSKIWKACQALGVLGILVGVTMLIIGIQTSGNRGLTAIGGLLFVVGFILYLVGRICGWWFNG